MINKMIPPEAGDGGFLSEKLKEQEAYMEEIHTIFDPLAMRRCYMMRTELRGLEKLDTMAEMLFGDEDPSTVYASESPMSFRTVDGVDELVMKMPFVDKSDIELFRIDSSMIMVQVGSQKRSIQLPDVLTRAEVSGASFKDGNLVIKFKR